VTGPQAKILGFIIDWNAARGFSPTVREISKAFGWKTTANVQQHIERMQRDGIVTRQAGMARTLRATPAGLEQLEELRQTA
jgi:SOS-response transcriptional repressor LexA